MTLLIANRFLSELGTPNTISEVILKSVAKFNSSELLWKERAKVLEKEPAPAQASDAEPQDEPPVGDAVENSNPSAQLFYLA